MKDGLVVCGFVVVVVFSWENKAYPTLCSFWKIKNSTAFPYFFTLTLYNECPVECPLPSLDMVHWSIALQVTVLLLIRCH